MYFTCAGVAGIERFTSAGIQNQAIHSQVIGTAENFLGRERS
jgi:hypothetical protein